MKDSLKVIVEAAKETPRLYFAPIVAAFQAVGKVEDAMIRTQRDSASGQFGKFVPKDRRQK
ncbi:hypothetical protein QZM35_22820 [Burkholderia sp. AU45274]|uniref:hypothetical protein n=1 Tax=Burkholderia sp. AU45274 TaxID=3059205 RepID=UPI002652B0F5|nr:hypothetical protein [Burkholderia sp. AU45274]MDN7490548.1 hypothetical protein [Burkholderia sp. AU45274]